MAGVTKKGQWSALAGAFLLATQAGAAEDRVPIRAHLELSGDVCGDTESLRARISRRAEGLQFVDTGYAVSVAAKIHEEPGGYVVHLSLNSAKAELLERRLETPPSCDDALDVLALIVAIGLEPLQSPAAPDLPRPRRRQLSQGSRGGKVASPAARAAPGKLRGRRAQQAVSSPAATTRPIALSLAVLETAVASTEARLPARARTLGSRELHRDRAPRRGRVFWGVAAGPRLLGGVAPTAMPGVRGAVRLALRNATLAESWPEISLALSRYWRSAEPTRGEEQLDFALTSVGVGLCPLRFGSEAFAFRPCVSLEAGRLRTTGRRTFGPISQVRGFRSAGLSLDGRWLFRSLQVGATARAAFAGPADRFTFAEATDADAAVAHAMRPWVWEAGLAIGWGLQ